MLEHPSPILHVPIPVRQWSEDMIYISVSSLSTLTFHFGFGFRVLNGFAPPRISDSASTSLLRSSSACLLIGRYCPVLILPVYVGPSVGLFQEASIKGPSSFDLPHRPRWTASCKKGSPISLPISSRLDGTVLLLELSLALLSWEWFG